MKHRVLIDQDEDGAFIVLLFDSYHKSFTCIECISGS